MAAVKFYSATQAKFDALDTKDVNAIYFIEDSGSIYKGSVNVTSDISVVTAVPTDLVHNKVAIVKLAVNGSDVYDIYVGSADNKPVKVVPGTVDGKETLADVDTYGAYVPTVKAVAEFVKDQVGSATSSLNDAYIGSNFDETSGVITFTQSDKSTETVSLAGVAHGVKWDADKLQLTIPEFGQADDVVVNIPKDMFVQNGEYVGSYKFNDGKDNEYTSPAIVLTINVTNGSETTQKIVAIPVKDLVDTYTVGSTDTVALTMDKNHNITASVVFDTTALTGNETILVKTTKGLAATTRKLSDIDTAITTAKSDAITAASADATKKADAAKTDAITAAAADAKTKADAALTDAKTYADGVADTAKTDAIAAAATDATTKANNALTSAKNYTDEKIQANELAWNTLE